MSVILHGAEAKMVRDRIMVIPVLSIVVLGISGCSDTESGLSSPTNPHSRFASGPSHAQYQPYATSSGQTSRLGSNSAARSQWYKADPQFSMDHPHPVAIPQHAIVYHPDPGSADAGPPSEDPSPIIQNQGNVYIHELSPAALMAEQQTQQSKADAAKAAHAARVASANAAAKLVPGSLLQRKTSAAAPRQADDGGDEQ